MVSRCVDRYDLVTINRQRLVNGPTVTVDGEYTLNQIDQFARDFAENYLKDIQNNPITVAVNKYGQNFYSSLNGINILSEFRDLTDYPDLNARVTRGKIGAVEYADFLNDFGITPITVQESITKDPLNLLFQLDSYYKDSFSTSILGGFCNQIQNAFAAIDAFFDIIESVQKFIVDALNFIDNAITFFSDLSIKKLVEQLIEEIKEKMKQVIENVWNQILSIIRNFKIVQIVENVATFVKEEIVNRAIKIKNDIEAIFTDENKKTILDKIEALFDYAVSLFERPTLEEIQFLVLRFCSFISNVEALLRDLTSPIENFSFKFQAIGNRLKTISTISTAAAVSAGAIRFDPETRKQKKQEIEIEWNTDREEALERIRRSSSSVETQTEGTNIITGSSFVEPIAELSRIVEENQPPLRKYSPKGTMILNVPQPTFQEVDDLPSVTEFAEAGHPIFRPPIGQNVKDVFDDWPYSWANMLQVPDFLVYLSRIHKEAGLNGPFIVTSAWRSQQTNTSVGGRSESRHLMSRAIDIRPLSLPYSKRDVFIKIARELYGFDVVDEGDHIHIEWDPPKGVDYRLFLIR